MSTYKGRATLARIAKLETRTVHKGMIACHKSRRGGECGVWGERGMGVKDGIRDKLYEVL